jgi:anti-sigma factor RsiW
MMPSPEQYRLGPGDHVSTEYLQRYCLGSLDKADSQVVKAHLDACSECTDRLVAVKRFVKMARGGKVTGLFDDGLG